MGPDGGRAAAWRNAAIGILIFGAAVAALLCSGKFTVNTSASVPVGLWLRTGKSAGRGDVVEVPFDAFRSTSWVPEAYHRANEVGRVAPYLKRVAGLPGDLIEAGEDGLIRVNGAAVPDSAPMPADRAGNVMRAFPLPVRLSQGEVWLSSDSPRGFDSRYLGPAKLERCTRVEPLITFR